MFTSPFMPCPECGASVARSSTAAHQCDPDRLLDFRMFGLRSEVEALEQRVQEFLESPSGRFERWVASRQVRGDA